MKKYLLILFCVFLISVNAWGEQKESRTVYLSQLELKKLNNGQSVYRWYDEGKAYGDGNRFMDEVRPPLQVTSVQEYETRQDIKETLDKIYSMIADIHIKEMGIDRYNQIYDPNNEREVAKQIRAEKMAKERVYGH